MVVTMEAIGGSEMTFMRCISGAVIGFANGMAPIMAVEISRRSLESHIKPTAEALEEMLKNAAK